MTSHTGLHRPVGNNDTMAKMGPLLNSYAQAETIGNAGGVTGLVTHLSDILIENANNIRAFVNVVEVEHVCIGSITSQIMVTRFCIKKLYT